ncbi:MAG: AAA family ATPase [Deltaproteobacteria bacterium]|nr:AAA family ATPase [Deltaproteobacteria bacterium]
MEPFGVTSDPAFYVPRLGTEAALTALREGFASGKRISVLTGPPGLGKTMVLHVLARDLTNARSRFLPYSALAPEDLAHFALAPGEQAEGESALAALARLAKKEGARPLVLLVDDAGALPPETSRSLRQLADSLGGALRVVAAIGNEARQGAAMAAFGEGLHHVRLKQPMLDREVGVYVRRRLELAGAAPDALHPQQIEWLATESGGVPRVINTLAARLLQTAVEIGSDVATAIASAQGESGARRQHAQARSRAPAADPKTAISVKAPKSRASGPGRAAPSRGLVAWLRALLRFRRH